MNRRSLIAGLLSLVAVPAAARLASIMPVCRSASPYRILTDGLIYIWTDRGFVLEDPLRPPIHLILSSEPIRWEPPR